MHILLLKSTDIYTLLLSYYCYRCCDNGGGGFQVNIEDEEVLSGGDFGSSDVSDYDFGVCTSDVDCDDLDDCTKDSCKAKACIYHKMPCDYCGKVKVSVSIFTDWIPEEISWILSRGDSGFGDVVMSGNSYSDVQYTYHEYKCLEIESYTFSIFDSGGNGIW